MEEMKALHNNRRLGCPYVFHRTGERIKRITRSWKTACIKVGLWEPLKDKNGNTVIVRTKKGKEKVVKVPTKIFHDFRRTSARNDVRAGIPERVVMKTKGWKTRSVFDRYNIVSDEDLKEAARKQEIYLNSQSKIENGYSLGTIEAKIANFER